MAARRRNGIWYEGRLINNKGQSKIAKSKNGKIMLDLVIAEQFQERNDRAPQEFRDPAKPADAYVNTHTAWHRLRGIADADNPELLALVTDPRFNHGAVLSVDATYREEAPWEDKGGKIHAGRRENVFFGAEEGSGGFIELKVLEDGRVLGARDEWAVPMWDGTSDLPDFGGGGSGGPAAPQYSDDEGF